MVAETRLPLTQEKPDLDQTQLQVAEALVWGLQLTNCYCDTGCHQCSTSQWWYSTLIGPSWSYGIVPAVQPDLLSEATPGEVF